MAKQSDIHPAAELFPLMSKSELAALAEDIRTNGQQEAIVYFKGQVLDGRNRLLACAIAGKKPDTCEIDDDHSFDPIAYVLSANLHRRHLNESQRSLVAARMKKLLEPDAKNRQREGGKSAGRSRPKQVSANLHQPNGKASDQAATLLNVGSSSVAHASTVLDKGSPELIAAVESGEVAVSKAAKVAKTTPRDKQVEVAKEKAKPQEKTPFDHLKQWWEKANETQQCLFRNWIDGKL